MCDVSIVTNVATVKYFYYKNKNLSVTEFAFEIVVYLNAEFRE